MNDVIITPTPKIIKVGGDISLEFDKKIILNKGNKKTIIRSTNLDLIGELKKAKRGIRIIERTKKEDNKEHIIKKTNFIKPNRTEDYVMQYYRQKNRLK